MSDKSKGLFRKYKVTKLSKPKEPVDCIVLEWGDPIARKAILAWAEAMRDAGHLALYQDVTDRLAGRV